MKAKRIGIYAGAFDPVHAGHLAFGLQALSAARLDKLYFLPERQPRGKPGAAHFGHRTAMLQRALKPHPQCDVLELTDVNFTAMRTLIELQGRFPGARLVLLFGSDAVASLAEWPKAERLLSETELVVGLRGAHTAQDVARLTKTWPASPRSLKVIESYAPDVSSSRVRKALQTRRTAHGLLHSVRRYSDRHWLYVSVA